MKDIYLDSHEDIVLFLIEHKGDCLLLENLMCRKCPLGPKDCKVDKVTYNLAIKYAMENKLITEEQGFELLL